MSRHFARLILVVFAVAAPSVTSAQSGQSAIAGVVRDSTGAVLPGVTRRGQQSGLDREVPVGSHRRGRSIPGRRSAAGHLPGHLHAPGVHHHHQGRHRARVELRGSGQRGHGGRRRRAGHHRHRRESDCRRAVESASGRRQQRDARGTPDRTKLRHHGRHRSGRARPGSSTSEARPRCGRAAA